MRFAAAAGKFWRLGVFCRGSLDGARVKTRVPKGGGEAMYTFAGDARRGGIDRCGLLGFGVDAPPEEPEAPDADADAIQSSLPHS
jgi:hypothetical protein